MVAMALALSLVMVAATRPQNTKAQGTTVADRVTSYYVDLILCQ